MFLRLFCRPLSRRDRAGHLRGFDVGFVGGGFELADGRRVAERGAVAGVVDGLAFAAIESAHAGNADCEDGDGGFDGCPDCDVYDIVCEGESAMVVARSCAMDGGELTGEVLRLDDCEQRHETDDIENEGNNSQCEHRNCSHLELLGELEAHDFADRNDDDENISEDVRDLQSIVEGNDRDASFVDDGGIPVCLHGHAKEESCQDDAGAPDCNDGNEDVDCAVEAFRMMREESTILHQDR